ncbi:hypothetical protein D3C71_1079020 [compost metagenome]
MAVALEQAHDAFLVRRGEFGENVCGLHRHRQFGVAHAFDVVAHQQALLLQPDFAADLRGHQFVVAGQHFHCHAVGSQRLERRRGAFFGWIKECHVTDQRQCLFIGETVGVASLDHRPRSHGDHPQAFGIERRSDLTNPRQQCFAQHFIHHAVSYTRAHRQYFFHGTFANQQMRLIALGDHHRHAPAGEVERDLVDLAKRRADFQFTVDLDVFEHRHIQQVFQAGLVVAVEVGHFQHVIGIVAPDVDVARQENPVLGQRAGLVGAQHVHGAEVLDGVQAFDDDFLARQEHRALGQGRGDDHRQHFRGQAHGNRQREQQCLGPVALGEAVDEQHQRRHDEHEADQQPTDFVDPGLERSRSTIGGADALGQGAEIGAVAGGEDHRHRGAGHHVGAHEQDVFQVQRIERVAVLLTREFFHRHRFAGHGRLTDEQVLGTEHPAIGGNHVASRQHDQVARHQLLDRQLTTAFVATQHRRGVADHRLERIGGLVGFAFLPEAQQGREHHHGKNHDGGFHVFGQPGDDRQQGQQQVERVLVAMP